MKVSVRNILPVINRIEKINKICEQEAEKLKKVCDLYFPSTATAYLKTGIYGFSLKAETLLKAYQYFYGRMPEQLAFFDSNQAKWGNHVLDTQYTILPPDAIKEQQIKRIVITAHRKYFDEIKEFLQDYIEEGTEICEL